jgi:hypothetical protein
MDNMRPENSFPQICVVSGNEYVEKQYRATGHEGSAYLCVSTVGRIVRDASRVEEGNSSLNNIGSARRGGEGKKARSPDKLKKKEEFAWQRAP